MLRNKLAGFREILHFDNWFEIALHHLLRRPDALAVYRFGGFEALVLRADGDANGLRRCLATDQYSQFLDVISTPRRVRIADLGAHTGGFIFCAISRGLDVAESISVEPNREAFARLEFNLRHNFGPQRCKAINAGVWSHRCTLDTSEGPGDTGARVRVSDESLPRHPTVPGITVNDVIAAFDGEDDIDICKMDVEGAEWSILSHPRTCDALPARCRHLIIEIHPAQDAPEVLIERLGSMGFEAMRKCAAGDETWLLRNVRLVPGA